MPRQKKKIHYMYKTTCKITNRFYIGIHSTTNIDDGYLGSGKRLRYSIRKYGIENHSKEILNFFDSRESLLECEKKIVNIDLVNDGLCMNLKVGGTGGLIGLPKKTLDKIRKGASDYMIEKWKNNDFRKKISKILIENTIKNHKKGVINYSTTKNKNISEEHKRKIGDKNKIKQNGEKNSQYGTCWITNGDENKKIKKDSLIPEGWSKGRIIK